MSSRNLLFETEFETKFETNFNLPISLISLEMRRTNIAYKKISPNLDTAVTDEKISI